MSTAKSKLHFRFGFHSTELAQIDLPVEVRRSNLTLVKRSMASQPVEVEAGMYFVTTRLPAGQELSSHVKVLEGEDVTVTLTPDLDEASPGESLEPSHFFRRSVATWSGRLEDLGGESVEVRLRWFKGNPLYGKFSKEADQTFIPNTWTKIPIPGGAGGTKWVQLLQRGRPALNAAVPVGPELRCDVRVPAAPSGGYALDIHVQNVEADALLGYLEKGLLDEAAVAANSPAYSAELLLRQKFKDPIAAAIGGYALLRLGELDRLHDWTYNLMNWIRWLPDGVAIHGEHLARLGKHDEALAAFVNIAQRGLPLFCDGLSYAVDRIRLYLSLWNAHFTGQPVKQEDAKATLAQLEPYLTFVDRREPVLTFTGLDPRMPNAQILTEELDSVVDLPEVKPTLVTIASVWDLLVSDLGPIAGFVRRFSRLSTDFLRSQLPTLAPATATFGGEFAVGVVAGVAATSVGARPMTRWRSAKFGDPGSWPAFVNMVGPRHFSDTVGTVQFKDGFVEVETLSQPTAGDAQGEAPTLFCITDTANLQTASLFEFFLLRWQLCIPKTENDPEQLVRQDFLADGWQAAVDQSWTENELRVLLYFILNRMRQIANAFLQSSPEMSKDLKKKLTESLVRDLNDSLHGLESDIKKHKP